LAQAQSEKRQKLKGREKTRAQEKGWEGTESVFDNEAEKEKSLWNNPS